MKIGFTGNRKGFTHAQSKAIDKVFNSLSAQTIEEAHHGDCIGSDTDFHFFVRDRYNNAKIVVHPPVNSSMRAFCHGDVIREQKDYLVRNKDIVKESDLIIATPGEKGEKLRSGTWSTIRDAKRNNKPIIIVFPDGKLSIKNVKILKQK
jgi:hypothetical protein